MFNLDFCFKKAEKTIAKDADHSHVILTLKEIQGLNSFDWGFNVLGFWEVGEGLSVCTFLTLLSKLRCLDVGREFQFRLLRTFNPQTGTYGSISPVNTGAAGLCISLESV